MSHKRKMGLYRLKLLVVTDQLLDTPVYQELIFTDEHKETRGGSRISGKGVHMYKGVGVRFADFLSFS